MSTDATNLSKGGFNFVPPARLHAAAVQVSLLLMVVLAALFVPNFVTTSNLSAILYAGAPVGVVAVGLALITLSGNLFALSLSATAGLSSIVFVSLLWGGFPMAAVATLLIGAFAGLCQGVVVATFRSNPIITSIAAGSLIGAAGVQLSRGRTVLAEIDLGWFGNGSLFPGLPYQALLFFAVALIAEWVIERSRTGRELRLTGMNSQAAQLAGIRVRRAITIAFVTAGATAALAGIMIASQAGAGNMRVGQDLDFSAIAAVLIGGVGIQGGHGRILDAAIGALFVAVLSNILLVVGFSYEVQLMVKGLAVIASVALAWALGRIGR